MNSRFYKSVFITLMASWLSGGISNLAFSAIVDLSLTPSESSLTLGDDFWVDVRMCPGVDSGDSIDLSSAEFNVFWDSSNLLPVSALPPPLGFTDPFGFSYAEWDPINPTGAAHLSATLFSNITVGSDGLLLMSIPLMAVGIAQSVNLDFDFFMESIGENSIWLNNNPLDLASVSFTGATVNVAPVPLAASIFLLWSGFGALEFIRRWHN